MKGPIIFGLSLAAVLLGFIIAMVTSVSYSNETVLIIDRSHTPTQIMTTPVVSSDGKIATSTTVYMNDGRSSLLH